MAFRIGGAGAALAILVVAWLALGSAPALAAPEDFVEACSNGIAVPDPEDNPGLVQDCAILLSIRDTLAGDAILDWTADKPVEKWDGVRLEFGRVIELALPARGLTGRIPPELGLLSQLEHLWLGFNQLKGGIPAELGDLRALEALNLCAAGLEGTIPESIGNLRSLHTLSLCANRLTGEIPDSLSRLGRLQTLFLQTNRLTGNIPASLAQMTSIRALLLDENDLQGPIPEALARLPHLEDLSLDRNRLTGEIPTAFGQMSSLRSLFLSENRLTGAIPWAFGAQPNLEFLWLSQNDLSGCVPPGLRAVEHNDADQLDLPDCPAPGDTGTGLAPAPHGALAAAVNVFAIVATVVAVLGIVAGLRTRSRP